jgi:hypothetical protein
VAGRRDQQIHGIGEAALADYLREAAVSELVIVEEQPGLYRLEALLVWRPGRSVLTAARGSVRGFRSLDTLRRFFATLEVGRTPIRIELLAE